jgi:hypothetical protein
MKLAVSLKTRFIYRIGKAKVRRAAIFIMQRTKIITRILSVS